MVLPGENHRVQRELCPSATSLTTTTAAWTVLRLNPVLHAEKPVTDSVTCDLRQMTAVCGRDGIPVYWQRVAKVSHEPAFCNIFCKVLHEVSVRFLVRTNHNRNELGLLSTMALG